MLRLLPDNPRLNYNSKIAKRTWRVRETLEASTLQQISLEIAEAKRSVDSASTDD